MSPTSPPKLCPRCRQRVPAGRDCPRCHPAWARKPASWSGSANSGAWKRLRARHLRAYPWCAWPGCQHVAEQVDHVVPIGEGGERLDPDNLRSLCEPHHRAVTAAQAEAARRRRRDKSDPG